MHLAPMREDGDDIPEQPQFRIGIKAAVPHPSAEKQVLARHGVTITRGRAGQHLTDFFRQLWADFLVGIERKNPIFRTEFKRVILLSCVATPWLYDYSRAILACDIAGAIGRARVHHYEFVCPAHAFEHASKIRLFIKRDDCDGKSVRQVNLGSTSSEDILAQRPMRTVA